MIFLDNRVRIQETEYETPLEYENDSTSIAVTTIEPGYDKSCYIGWTHQSSLVMKRRARFDGSVLSVSLVLELPYPCLN